MEKVFFFSSRRRHTRWNCDWSSDVCSSDLFKRTARPRACEHGVRSDVGVEWDIECRVVALGRMPEREKVELASDDGAKEQCLVLPRADDGLYEVGLFELLNGDGHSELFPASHQKLCGLLEHRRMCGCERERERERVGAVCFFPHAGFFVHVPSTASQYLARVVERLDIALCRLLRHVNPKTGRERRHNWFTVAAEHFFHNLLAIYHGGERFAYRAVAKKRELVLVEKERKCPWKRSG